MNISFYLICIVGFNVKAWWSTARNRRMVMEGGQRRVWHMPNAHVVKYQFAERESGSDWQKENRVIVWRSNFLRERENLQKTKITFGKIRCDCHETWTNQHQHLFYWAIVTGQCMSFDNRKCVVSFAFWLGPGPNFSSHHHQHHIQTCIILISDFLAFRTCCRNKKKCLHVQSNKATPPLSLSLSRVRAVFNEEKRVEGRNGTKNPAINQRKASRCVERCVQSAN